MRIRAHLDSDMPPPAATLAELRAAEAQCSRCPLYRFATQVVPGEGRVRSRLMLVGEQPGDREDLAGRPFVGPAGRIVDQALEAAGIARNNAFVTNAVEHFKHEMRGKLRLHKRPNAYDRALQVVARSGACAGRTACDRCPRRHRRQEPVRTCGDDCGDARPRSPPG